MLLACVVAVAGTVSLPLDDHDVFAVETAQEMRVRHDWVVPYCFGKPRLAKPPLGYWAIAGVATLVQAPRVLPWHGRAPAITGGVGFVIFTMAIGLALADGSVAALAGIIAATSTAFFRYTHSARPDMLYTCFCTLMLAAYLRQWRPLVFWMAAVLATLTKGPHVPGMFLAAIAVVEWREHGWSWNPWRRLRPLGGAVLLVAFTIPWWWVVHRRLGGTGIAGSELMGSLFHFSATSFVDPYYLYHALALLLPSSAILVVAAVWRCWPLVSGAAARRLLPFVVVPMIIFAVGLQHRPHYLLPVLAPLCLLLALAVRTLVGHAAERAGGGWLPRVVAGTWAVTIVVAIAGARTPLLWSRERFAMADLGAVVARELPSGTPIFALDVGAATPAYYAARTILPARKTAPIVKALTAAPEGVVGVLSDRDTLDRLPKDVQTTVLAGARVAGNREIVLATVRPHGA